MRFAIEPAGAARERHLDAEAIRTAPRENYPLGAYWGAGTMDSFGREHAVAVVRQGGIESEVLLLERGRHSHSKLFGVLSRQGIGLVHLGQIQEKGRSYYALELTRTLPWSSLAVALHNGDRHGLRFQPSVQTFRDLDVAFERLQAAELGILRGLGFCSFSSPFHLTEAGRLLVADPTFLASRADHYPGLLKNRLAHTLLTADFLSRIPESEVQSIAVPYLEGLSVKPQRRALAGLRRIRAGSNLNKRERAGQILKAVGGSR